MPAIAKSRGARMRKKTPKRSVRKVFKDLGVAPAEAHRKLIPLPAIPWPSPADTPAYRTVLSNGTGRAMRFDAELE